MCLGRCESSNRLVSCLLRWHLAAKDDSCCLSSSIHVMFLTTFHGCLSEACVPISLAALCLLAYGSVQPFQKTMNCYWAGAVGWILALTTGQPAFAFHGSGFVASLMQGVAHRATNETANLPELARRTGCEKAGDEHAHTSFFPCLILHSAHESCFGKQQSD